MFIPIIVVISTTVVKLSHFSHEKIVEIILFHCTTDTRAVTRGLGGKAPQTKLFAPFLRKMLTQERPLSP